MLVISRFSFVLFCALGVFVCKSFTSFLARFISIFNFKNNRKRFRNTIGGIYYFVISSLTSLMYLEEGISRFGISYISLFHFPTRFEYKKKSLHAYLLYLSLCHLLQVTLWASCLCPTSYPFFFFRLFSYTLDHF